MNVKQAKENIESESLLRQETKRAIRKNDLPVTGHAFASDIKERSFEDEEENEANITIDDKKTTKDRVKKKRDRLKQEENKEEKEDEDRLSHVKYKNKKNKEKDLSKKRAFIISEDHRIDPCKEKKYKKYTQTQIRQLEYFKRQLDPKKTSGKERINTSDRIFLGKRHIKRKPYMTGKYLIYDNENKDQIQDDTGDQIRYMTGYAAKKSSMFIPNVLRKAKKITVLDADLIIQEKKNLLRYVRAKRQDDQIFYENRFSMTKKITSKIKQILKRNQTGLVIAAICLAFFISMAAAAGIIFEGVSEATATYLSGLCLSTDFDMTDCENYYTKMEADLGELLDDPEEYYPGYDRYIIDFNDEIGHDPIELMAYLSAVYEGYDLSLIRYELDELFNDMYMVETISETVIENDEEIKVFTIKVVKRSWDDLMSERMDDDRKELYDSYSDSAGGHQAFHNPFEINWSDKVTSEFGWRIHPISGEEKFHRGIDIAMPAGTPVKSCSKGTVVKSTYSDVEGNYVVIEDECGYRCHYMHLSERNVSVGDEVDYDSVIGNVGSTGYSTGPHLHLQISDDNGEVLNPRFMVMGGN